MSPRRRRSSDEANGCLGALIIGAILAYWSPKIAAVVGGLLILGGLASLGQKRKRGEPSGCAVAVFGVGFILIAVLLWPPSDRSPQVPSTNNRPSPTVAAPPAEKARRVEPEPLARPGPARPEEGARSQPKPIGWPGQPVLLARGGRPGTGLCADHLWSVDLGVRGGRTPSEARLGRKLPCGSGQGGWYIAYEAWNRPS